MCIAGLGPIRALVGEVAELVAFEALELAKTPRLTMEIIDVCFAAGCASVIILHKVTP